MLIIVLKCSIVECSRHKTKYIFASPPVDTLFLVNFPPRLWVGCILTQDIGECICIASRSWACGSVEYRKNLIRGERVAYQSRCQVRSLIFEETITENKLRVFVFVFFVCVNQPCRYFYRPNSRELKSHVGLKRASSLQVMKSKVLFPNLLKKKK